MEPDDDARLRAIEDALGHAFSDRAHLRDALTHRSFRNERPRLAPADNERLEFLGDALLGLAVARMLFVSDAAASEGTLTRRRADLVREGTLAEVATSLGLGDALRLGKGEDRSGGRMKPRLLASALEALVGAVAVDGGFPRALEVVERLLAPRVRDAGRLADAKSELQERAQGALGLTPTYVLVDTSGPDHERTFKVAVWVGDEERARGLGRSKAEAEQLAARAALIAWP